MALYKFKSSDIFYSRIKAHQKCEFFINDSNVHYNRRQHVSGSFTSSVPAVKPGDLSVFEYNIDRPSLFRGATPAQQDLSDDELLDGGVPNPQNWQAAENEAGANPPAGVNEDYDGDISSGSSPAGNTLTVPFGPGTEENFPLSPSGTIRPFIIKGAYPGDLVKFKNISDVEYRTQFQYGDVITGSYPVTARISRKFFDEASNESAYNATASMNAENPWESYDRREIRALKNTMNSYSTLSKHYLYIYPPDLEYKRYDNDDGGQGDNNSSFPSTVDYEVYGWDKEQQAINLISIPSIFYGSAIQKGTVSLKYYITGSLIGELRDEKFNGELVQVGPTGSLNSGSTVGVILYNEGFILLTGSWGIGAHTNGSLTQPQVKFGSTAVDNSWLYFGYGANDGNNSAGPDEHDDGVNSTSPISASFDISFNGTTYVPTITMFTHAPKARLNTSTNPTFVQAGQTIEPYIRKIRYNERQNRKIKNTISSSYPDPTGSFAKQTFITKVGVYDENKNLIAVASVANPVKKLEDLAYTFKIKMDI